MIIIMKIKNLNNLKYIYITNCENLSNVNELNNVQLTIENDSYVKIK